MSLRSFLPSMASPDALEQGRSVSIGGRDRGAIKMASRELLAAIRERLLKLVTVRIDARAMATARILVGLAAFVKAWVIWRVMAKVLLPGRLELPYFDWLPRVSADGLSLFVGLWMVAAIMFLLGGLTRIAGFALVFLQAYALAQDEQYYSNHLYLLSILCFLLAIGGGGARWSIDAWLRGDRPTTVAAWPAILMMCQLTIVYFFAAVSKLNLVYLSGSVLNAHFARNAWIDWPDVWRVWWVFAPMAWGAVLGELFLAFALWSRRWRGQAARFGVIFHLGILIGMPRAVTGDLVVFALTMFSVYVLFFARPHVFGAALAGDAPNLSPGVEFPR